MRMLLGIPTRWTGQPASSITFCNYVRTDPLSPLRILVFHQNNKLSWIHNLGFSVGEIFGISGDNYISTAVLCRMIEDCIFKVVHSTRQCIFNYGPID